MVIEGDTNPARARGERGRAFTRLEQFLPVHERPSGRTARDSSDGPILTPHTVTLEKPFGTNVGPFRCHWRGRTVQSSERLPGGATRVRVAA